MKVLAKAPTKVTLFGEHSVVYGEPALVYSIPIYVEVEMKESENLSIITGPINLSNIDLTIKENEVYLGERSKSEILQYMKYIMEALKKIDVTSVEIKIASPLPVGAGVGTSAAVSVATIAAAMALKDIPINKETIAKRAWEVELSVQGKASPMDTHASAIGGVLWIERRGSEWKLERLEGAELPLVVALFEKRKTTAQLVREVAKKVEANDIYKKIIKIMGEIARKAKEALLDGDLEALGEMMNVNHAMLEALGVVNKEVSEAVHSALLAGAYGAKVSGAGSGGAVVALADDLDSVAAALLASGARKVFVLRSPSQGVEVYKY